MAKFYLTLIIFILSINLYSQDLIKEKYPFFREFRASFNITFGAASMIKAQEALDDDKASKTENNIAYGILAIGLLRLTDGAYYFFNESPVEGLLKEGKLNPTSKDYKKHLREAAAFEKKLRTYRGIVIILNGLGFFALYDQDKDRNDYAVVPGVGMMLVGSYALWRKGPAETQEQNDIGNMSFNFNYIKQDNKFIPMGQLNFTF